MPIVQLEGGKMRDLSGTSQDVVDSREELTAEVLNEMLYSKFEQNIAENEARGIHLPPATDMSGRVIVGDATGYYQGQGTYHAAANNQGGYRQGAAMPPSQSEQAVSAMMEVREDMIKNYASVSRDPVLAASSVSSIRKMEAQIISMGGDIDRFDPNKFKSGFATTAAKTVNPDETAKMVVENTKGIYTLLPINKIYSGRSSSGRLGLCVKLACSSGAEVCGTIIPKTAFAGNEAIDFVPDEGKGLMSVKAPKNGYWEDVSKDFEIAWKIEKPAPQA
jgi:hypothetical protein